MRRLAQLTRHAMFSGDVQALGRARGGGWVGLLALWLGVVLACTPSAAPTSAPAGAPAAPAGASSAPSAAAKPAAEPATLEVGVISFTLSYWPL